MENSINNSGLNKKDFWLAGLTFLISFIVYLKTLCPTVYVGDSGELIAAAYTLGIAHPPGYPLYCLLGKLFTFLPFGSIAFRVNLMSAFFASLTVALVYLIVLKIQVNGSAGQQVNGQTGQRANGQTGRPLTSHIPAFAAALIFAFSPIFWSQAVVAEVYTLNAFFLTLLIFVLFKWKEACGLKPAACSRYLYLFSLIYGLGLAHHTTLLFLLPVIVFFLLTTDHRLLIKRGSIFVMLLLFLLALGLYLYLPLRSLAHPPNDWGNPENWSSFLVHISARQYQNLLFKTSLSQILENFKEACLLLLQQFPVYAVLLFFIGGIVSVKKMKDFPVFILLLWIIFIHILFVLVYNAPVKSVKEVYFIPSIIALSLLIGCGIYYLAKKGEEVNKKINFGGKTIYRYVAPLLILSLPLLPLSRNYSYNDRSRHYLAYDLGMNILKTLDEKAILFTEGDHPTFALAYLTLVEKKRPDVTIYDRNGNLFQDVYGFSQLRRIRLPGSNLIILPKEKKNRRRTTVERRIITTSGRPVYYMAKRKMDEMPGYTLEQVGIVYRVSREGEAPSKEELGVWRNYNLRGLDEEIFKDYMSREIIAQYHYHLGKYYGQMDEPEKAVLEYEKASRVGWDIKEIHYNLGRVYYRRGWTDKAIEEYERVAELDSGSVMAHNNLGASYAQKGWHQKARNEWEKALEIDPKNEEAQRNLERLNSMGTNK